MPPEVRIHCSDCCSADAAAEVRLGIAENDMIVALKNASPKACLVRQDFLLVGPRAHDTEAEELVPADTTLDTVMLMVMIMVMCMVMFMVMFMVREKPTQRRHPRELKEPKGA